jgi:hypothetical protein
MHKKKVQNKKYKARYLAIQLLSKEYTLLMRFNRSKMVHMNIQTYNRSKLSF